MARHAPGPTELDYINPETGSDILPALGFTAMMLPAGTTESPVRKSSSQAFHVVSGRGRTTIDGQSFDWGPKDTFTAPVFAEIDHVATDESFLIRVHDRPLQDKLGYYEERAR
jgi:gentisate 1,2-dioxygenase